MKHKLLAIFILTSIVLCGCGQADNGSASETTSESSASEAATEEATEGSTAETTDEPETDAPAEPETEPETEPEPDAPESTEAPEESSFPDAAAGGRMDMYPAIYQSFVQNIWDVTAEENDGNVSIDYALRDLDADGLPELLFKHGTCEADYVIDIYTVQEDLTKMCELPGGHTSFGYDENTGELVLIWGHMGSMELDWYYWDGEALSVRNSAYYTMDYDDPESYDPDSFLRDNNIQYLDFVSAFAFGGDMTPQSYVYSAGQEIAQYDGLYLDLIA